MLNIYFKIHFHLLIKDLNLSQWLQQYWSVEKPLIWTKTTIKEIEYEKHYIWNITHKDGGRNMMSLPFKINPTNLGNSFDQASWCFRNVEIFLYLNHDTFILAISTQVIWNYSIKPTLQFASSRCIKKKNAEPLNLVLFSMHVLKRIKDFS